MKVNDETYIQIYLVSWLKKLQAKHTPHKFIFFSVPNGGSRNKMEAQNIKLSGLLAGVPDLCFLYSGGVFFIELKKKTGGKLSTAQKTIISDIETLGHKVYVVYADTPEEAIQQVDLVLAEQGLCI